jgi:hypothetical protein
MVVIFIPSDHSRCVCNDIKSLSIRTQLDDAAHVPAIPPNELRQLGPARRRQWVSGPDLRAVWDSPAPETLAEDLEQFPGEIDDDDLVDVRTP